MDTNFLIKILDSDISKEAKEKILFYWLLPKEDSNVAPIQIEKSKGKAGAIKRPSKEELDLRKNPKKVEISI